MSLNINSLQQELTEVAAKAELGYINTACRENFAKVSLKYGELSEVVNLIDNPSSLQKLKPSDIVSYQERIQDLLQEIKTCLDDIKKQL